MTEEFAQMRYLDMPVGGTLPPNMTYQQRGEETVGVWLRMPVIQDNNSLIYVSMPTQQASKLWRWTGGLLG